MRAIACTSTLLFLLAACNPLDSSDKPGGSASSTSATSEGPCSRYMSCIAQTSPALLGEMTDTYGKSGSCWNEMSSGECESACRVGLAQLGCRSCDPGSESCLGEACSDHSHCADGEYCTKGACETKSIKPY